MSAFANAALSTKLNQFVNAVDADSDAYALTPVDVLTLTHDQFSARVRARLEWWAAMYDTMESFPADSPRYAAVLQLATETHAQTVAEIDIFLGKSAA